MKRLWAALAMAVVIAAIIISGLFFIKKYSKEVNITLKTAAAAAQSGDMRSAAKLCEIAEDEWVKAEKVLRIFVNANELSDIGLSPHCPNLRRTMKRASCLRELKQRRYS